MPLEFLGFTWDGRFVVTADGTDGGGGNEQDRFVRVWDPYTGGELLRYQRRVSRAVLSPASYTLATIESPDEQNVHIMDLSSGSDAQLLYGHQSRIESINFSSDGTALVGQRHR